MLAHGLVSILCKYVYLLPLSSNKLVRVCVGVGVSVSVGVDSDEEESELRKEARAGLTGFDKIYLRNKKWIQPATALLDLISYGT